MQLFSIAGDTKKMLMFSVIFLYLAGPVIRVYHAYLSDIFFLVSFVIIVLSGTRMRFNTLSYIFLVPSVIVLISVLGKLFLGYAMGQDEIANLLNYVKLFFLYVTAYSVFFDYSEINSLKKDLKILNNIVIFFIIFICAIGILQFINNPAANFIIKNFYHVVHKTGTDNIYEFELLNRVTGIFDSFNGMGIVLCFTLFILVYINSELKNYWSIIVLLLGITLIFLTGNRASLIILFVMSGSYLLYAKKGINLKIFSIIFGTFILSGIIFFLIADYLSFDNFIRFYEFKLLLQNGSIPPTLQVRLDKWQWLPQYMSSVTQGLFGYTTNDFLNDKVYTSPDNQYLNWLVYYGYIGAVSFILWIFYSLVIIFKNRRDLNLSAKFLNNSSSFIIIYWLGLFIIGFFQESFFFGRLRELFIFSLALIAAYQQITQKNVSKYNHNF